MLVTDKGPSKREFHRMAAMLLPILETISHREPNLELVSDIDESDAYMTFERNP